MKPNKIPSIIAFFVFLAGLANIASSIWATAPERIAWLENFIPLDLSNLSRTLTVISGLVLILLAKSLHERKLRALYISLFFLSLSVVTHLFKGLDVEEVITNLIIIVALIRYRALFVVRSHRLSAITFIKSSLSLILAFLMYLYIGHYGLGSSFSGKLTIRNISLEAVHLTTGYGRDLLKPQDQRARWYHDSIVVVEALVVLTLLASSLSPFIDKRQSDEDWDLIASLVSRLGKNSVSPLSLMSDKSYFLNKDRTGVISYAVSGHYAVALGDPICYEEDIEHFLSEYYLYLESCGLTPVWYNCREELLPHLSRYKVKTLAIGQEAVIKLSTFDLRTSALKDVRNALTKLNKLGVTYEVFPLSELPWRVLSDIEVLHEEWLKSKHIPPMGFSMEYYPFPVTEGGFVLVSYLNSKLLSALSVFPYNRSSSYVLDMMIRGSDTPNGIMEGSVAKMIEFLHSQNVEYLNLSLAPLAGSTARGLDLLAKWYKFKPLKSFKDKFSPHWVSKYLAYSNNLEIPGVLIALGKLHFRKP